MKTNAHPLASIPFMTRPFSVKPAGLDCGIPPRAQAHITTVRTSGVVFEKPEGRGESWVKVS